MNQQNGMGRDKNQIASGLIWAYAERIMAQGVSLLVTIILARLILPEDFGAITIVTVFINIANTFATDGFGTALIQKKKVDIEDYSSVFFFSLGFSGIMYLIIFLIAPYIAHFYKMSILIPALRVMAIRVILAGINTVQQAYISRNMQFKKFFISTSFGTCISAVIGVGMAYKGFGIWALVFQYISNALIDTVILFITSGLHIKFVYSQRKLSDLLRYGWKLVVSSLMISIYSNVRDLIIGKKYSSADLAFYNKGNQFPSFISSNINTSISKVLFPALSSCQDDTSSLKRMTSRSISIGVYVLSPVLIGFAAVSEAFVKIALTDKWLPCVPYLRIFCIIFLLQPLQTSSLQAMKALGKSELYLKLEVIKKIFGVIVLIISIFAFNSVLSIAIGALVAEIFSTLVNLPFNRSILNYKYREQISDICPSLLLAIAMGGVVYVFANIFESVILTLLVQMVIGFAFYIVASWILKFNQLQYIWSIISNYLKNFRRNE